MIRYPKAAASKATRSLPNKPQGLSLPNMSRTLATSSLSIKAAIRDEVKSAAASASDKKAKPYVFPPSLPLDVLG